MQSGVLVAGAQITVWGTSDDGDSEVSDYANKQWAGLLSTFYHARCFCKLPSPIYPTHVAHSPT